MCLYASPCLKPDPLYIGMKDVAGFLHRPL